MNKKVFLILTILFIAVSLISNENEMTITAIFERLKINHPQFTRDSKTLEAEIQKKHILQASHPWYFFTTPYNNYYGSGTAQQYKAETADLLGIKFGIANHKLDTGGSLDVSFSSQMEFLTNPAADVPPFSYKNTLEIEYLQPLLNNTYVEQKKYSIIEQDFEKSIISLLIKEKQKQLYFQAAELFIYWLYLSEVREIIEERVDIAGDLYERVKQLYNSDLIDKIDIIRSEDSLRSAELLYSQSLIQLAAVVKHLTLLTNLEISEETIPVFSIDEIPVVQVTDIFSIIFNESTTTKIIDIKIKKIKEKIKYLEISKSLSSTMNIKGGISGKNPDFLNSFTELRPDASVYLGFEVPLDNKYIDEEIKLIRIQIEELEENKKTYRLNLQARFDTIISYCESYKETFHFNKEFIQSAITKTREEIKIYNQGRGQLTFVLQSRDDEEKAKISYAENLYKARKSFLEYLFLFDNPLEKLNQYMMK
jgi:hypothetical protein